MLFVRTKIKRSYVHGIGLFANQNIMKGELIWKFIPPFDLQIEVTEVDKLAEPAREQFMNYAYLSTKTGRYILCFDDDRFINHSNSPNVLSSNEGGEEGSVIAARDIREGKELVCDYREFDADFARRF